MSQRQVDVAMAWGPLAGYFAAQSRVPLAIRPVAPVAGIPLQFSISMGVRKGNTTLQHGLELFLVAKRLAIADVLKRFHVPTVPEHDDRPTPHAVRPQ